MKNEDKGNRQNDNPEVSGNTSEIDIASRRSKIEHSRNIELSEQEIIARKKAHAERRAEQKKKAQKGQRTKKPDPKKRKSAIGRNSFERARSGDDGKRDVVGRSRKHAAPNPEQEQEFVMKAVPVELPEREPAREEPVPEKPEDTVPEIQETPDKPNKKEKPVKNKKKRSSAKKSKDPKPQPEEETSREPVDTEPEPFVKPRFKPVEMPSYIERKITQTVSSADDEEVVDMQDFRRRRKRLKMKKRLKRLILVLILAVIAASVYFTRGLWVPKLEGILEKPKETIVNDGVVQAGNFPIDLSESNILGAASLDGNIITVDSTRYTVYDPSGKVKDTVYHNMGTPAVRAAGKRMLLFDNGSDIMKLYSRNGQVFEKKLDGTVVFGAVAENGNSLAVTVDDKNAAKITVFDKNGSELYKWANGDRIIDASFSQDGESFTAATFCVADGKMTSRVTCVELKDKNLIVESDEIDGLVIRAAVNSKGNMWALTREKLFLLSEVGSIIDSYEFVTSPVSFDLCADCVCAVTRQVTTGQTVISIFDAQSDKLAPKIITPAAGKAKKVVCCEGKAFVLGTDSLDAYLPDGSLASTAAVSDGYTDFVYCDNAAYLLGRREMNKIVFKT